MKKAGCLIGFAVFFGMITALIVLACVQDAPLKKFVPYLDQYISAGVAGETSLPGDMKAIVIVSDNQTELSDPARYYLDIDEYKMLPKDMRAKTPDEVNTVIRISKLYDLIGNYVNPSDGSAGADAYAVRAYVTIVNLKTGIICARDRLFTNNPPANRYLAESGKVFADVPMDEILRFMQESRQGND
jgi:hypothetical protein